MYEAGFFRFRPILTPYSAWNNWAFRLDFWTHAFSRHGLNAELIAPAKNASDAAAQSFAAFGRMKGASIGGEKMPAYCSELLSICQQQPMTSLIVLWRNPFEVLSSIQTAALAKSGAVFERFDRVSATIREIDALFSNIARVQASGHVVKIVSFSALQNDPCSVMADLASFLCVINIDSWLIPMNGETAPIPPTANNKKVRGGKFLQFSGMKSQSVSQKTRKRLDRWIALWRRRYPESPIWICRNDLPENCNESFPSFTDRVAVRMAGYKETFKLLLFSFLPISIWTWYRKFRQRHRTRSET